MINIVRVDVIYGEEMTAACIVVSFGVSLKISNEEYPCPGVSFGTEYRGTRHWIKYPVFNEFRQEARLNFIKKGHGSSGNMTF